MTCRYVLAFLVTLAIELPVAWALAPRGARRGALLDAALLNAASHPLAVVLFWFHGVPRVAVEALVWAGEAGGYRLLGYRVARAVSIALVANALSTAAIGPFERLIGG